MITGGEGLFAQANGAATKYNQAAKNEADLLNQLLNSNYLNTGETQNKVAKVGDFVNYSVVVDGTKYDKWRILHLNRNGHMEIVCYNGPDFEFTEELGFGGLGEILSGEAQSYINETYGNSARHLGTNPNGTNETYEVDVDSLQAMEGNKKLLNESWFDEVSESHYGSGSDWHGYADAKYVDISGVLHNARIFHLSYDDVFTFSDSLFALAPIIALKSEITVDLTKGDGSIENPFELVKN